MPVTKTPKVTLAYVRVSTDEQAEHGFGLEAQIAKVRAYCEALGKPLAGIVKDDGYSGGTLDRPGLQDLIERIRAGEIGTVVIAKLDRLSRSLRNLLNVYADEFEANDVALISVAEQFDTSTPAGRLFFQMVGSFAEFERGLITERTSGGRKQKAQRGGYAGGRAPLGYAAQRGSKVLALDEEGAAAVRRAFELDAQGMTQVAVADALNREGFTTAQGKPFGQVQVHRILKRREFYAGAYSYAGIEAAKGEHTAILDPTQAAAL